MLTLFPLRREPDLRTARALAPDAASYRIVTPSPSSSHAVSSQRPPSRSKTDDRTEDLHAAAEDHWLYRPSFTGLANPPSNPLTPRTRRPVHTASYQRSPASGGKDTASTSIRRKSLVNVSGTSGYTRVDLTRETDGVAGQSRAHAGARLTARRWQVRFPQ